MLLKPVFSHLTAYRFVETGRGGVTFLPIRLVQCSLTTRTPFETGEGGRGVAAADFGVETWQQRVLFFWLEPIILVWRS